MTREQIIEAIRAGYLTTSAIADFTGENSDHVASLIARLKASGRLYHGPKMIVDPISKKVCYEWHIDENWKPKPRPPQTEERRAKASAAIKARIAANPEAEAARLAKCRATWASKRVQIPACVEKSHRKIYRAIARVLDEETAALFARRAKAMGASNIRPDEPAPLTVEARH